MAAKIYIGAGVLKQTKELLERFKENNPSSTTPMADAFRLYGCDGDYDRSRYFRAARQLGWNVVRQGGAYFENGFHVWYNAK